MRRKIFRCRATLVFAFCFALSSAFAAEEEVIFEDFEDEVMDGNLVGTAAIQDPGEGQGTVLSLTQGTNSQAGFAWFNAPFNLRDKKVTIEFDFYIRPGTSADPADGMSVIFQFGDDTTATGAGGGGLGTGGFPTEYVSVAFDIWDNGPTDPETPCDNNPGNHTCHVEVNQNNWPGADPSLQTNVDLGTPCPDFTQVGATVEPVHARIVFDSGTIQVFFRIDGDAVFNEEQEVLKTVLQDFPADAAAILGFAASTGGANAYHEVDNVRVVTDDPTPQINVTVKLGDGDKGAINCGSAEEATGTVNGETFTFAADVQYEGFLGTDTTVVPNENRFAGYGFTAGPNPAGPIPDSIANVDDPNLQPVFKTERWNNGPVAYRFDVNNGRFEVNLLFAEICPACGVGAGGEATRRIHASLEGERVLTHWSSALAAGREAGTGPAALTAVVRTFQVDVRDGTLDVVISDVGLLGTPPENAQINGISYRRTGDATGDPAQGDIEDFGPMLLPDITRTVLVDTDFDSDDLGACPEGWSCNDNGVMAAQIVDTNGVYGTSVSQRLRLTDHTGGAAADAIFATPADLSFQGFEAEFTAYLTQPYTATCVADGMTFFFIQGDDTALSALGASGGSLGYSGIGYPGFAVEIDTYQGAGDPGGIPQTQEGHVALVVNGDVTQHVQTSNAMDPAFDEPDWPLVLDESRQFLLGTQQLEENGAAGIRVRVSLNNGRFRVWIASVNDDPALGFVYPETLVLDTLTDYGVPELGEGYFGFSAATGGCMTYHEIDDVKITLILNKAAPVTRSIPKGTTYNDSSSRIDVALDVSVVSGTGAHDIVVKENLPPGWSAEDISDGGTVTNSVVTWNLTGLADQTTLTYRLIPSDETKSDVGYAGAFSVDGGPELPIEGSAFLLWAPAPFPRGSAQVVLEEDFDGAEGCPDGWTCNTSDAVYSPGVFQDGTDHSDRLQLTADQVPNLAATVFWNTPIDLTRNSLVAEFDLYMASDPAAGNPIPADGFTFMIVEDLGNDSLTALGAGGGGLGYLNFQTALGAVPRSLAVEFDTWQGFEDPNGYNVTGYGHAAVLRDADVTTHVQTNLDLDPGTTPQGAGGDGWPYFVDQTGAGIPLHVEIEYNNGNIKVYLDAPETFAGEGTGEPDFEQKLILDTSVTFPDSDDPPDGVPDVLGSVYVGFSGGTGGADAYHEIDDLKITLYPKEGGGESFSRGDANDDGNRNIADAIFILGYLFAGGDAPRCPDAADANDDGNLNIADAISVLGHLFGGTGPLPAPFPGCGSDPTGDTLGPCVTANCP